jgi:hypothetical protein
MLRSRGRDRAQEEHRPLARERAQKRYCSVVLIL